MPYILDGGPCRVGLESTIAGIENGVITIFRKGGLPIEAIEAVVGPVRVKAHSTSNPQAPGMLHSHYAPGVPLQQGELRTLYEQHRNKKVGVLAFQRGLPEILPDRQIVLSPAGDLEEAAQRLFAAMRQLDQMPIDLILAETFPETGLGRAINDRLRRASAR